MYTSISRSQLFVLDQDAYGLDFGVRDPFGNAIRTGQMFSEAGS